MEPGKCQGASVREFDGVSMKPACRTLAPVVAKREAPRRAPVFGPFLPPHYEWDRVAYSAAPSNRECVILSCPQFLLTGVGY